MIRSQDSNDLPEPKIVALEIMEDLQNALDQFSLITMIKSSVYNLITSLIKSIFYVIKCM